MAAQQSVECKCRQRMQSQRGSKQVSRCISRVAPSGLASPQVITLLEHSYSVLVELLDLCSAEQSTLAQQPIWLRAILSC